MDWLSFSVVDAQRFGFLHAKGCMWFLLAGSAMAILFGMWMVAVPQSDVCFAMISKGGVEIYTLINMW